MGEQAAKSISEKGYMSEEKLSKVSNWLEPNFKSALLIKVDHKRSEPMYWLLANRKLSMFLLDLSVVGADYDDKS